MKHCLAVMLACCAVPSISRAEICYSDAQNAAAAVPPTSSTFFNCPDAGHKTLTELAQAGFVVIKLAPLIVGQAGPELQSAQQLIIELPARVFASGFESGS